MRVISWQRICWDCFTLALFVGLIVVGLLYWLTLPEVQYSWRTNECVQVIDFADKYACENLPEKYRKVWVK